MPYTPDLKEHIKAVESTRAERIARKKAGNEFTVMTLAEREKVLELFHPDCRAEGRRALLVGPNKGYRVAHEFADILEAWNRVPPEKVDLGSVTIETDVLIIGGGGGRHIRSLTGRGKRSQCGHRHQAEARRRQHDDG